MVSHHTNEAQIQPEGTEQPKAVARKFRFKSYLQNIALAGATFLFCFVVLEIALRLCGFGNLEIYSADPVLYWRLKPKQDCFTKVDHKPVHINSLGTRGPEFSIAKPANTIRILSLGDSKTFGWGLTEAEAYSALVEGQLRQYLGSGKKVEVINAGVNAWSFPQMFNYLRTDGLSYQPDIVLLADANLWTQFSEQNSPEFVKKFMWRVRIKNFLRRLAIYHYVVEYQLQAFYEHARQKFVPIDPKQDELFKEQQQKDPDAFFRDYIERICSLSLSNHVKPVLLFIPTTLQLEEKADSQVLRAKKRVAAKFGVPLVDLTPELKPEGKSLYLDADTVHLNVRGNVIVANKLYPVLTNIVTQ
jgi:lysophospholipase L1-like esterase